MHRQMDGRQQWHGKRSNRPVGPVIHTLYTHCMAVAPRFHLKSYFDPFHLGSRARLFSHFDAIHLPFDMGMSIQPVRIGHVVRL